MALMRLGSKSDEEFRREGQTWNCTTGLPSDVTIQVGEVLFFLHKFPLLSRSGLLKKLIAESSNEDGSSCVLDLHDIPGGDKTFDFITRFCYGVKIEVTASNVVSLRCAAEYLQMNENYGEGNLVSKTEAFLNEVFSNWPDSIKAIQTCEEVQPYAESLHIVSRCIDALAVKVYSGPNLFNKPKVECDSPQNQALDPALWNGISSETNLLPQGDDWWYEDACLLSLSLYKRLILAIETKGMKPESVSGSLMYYIRRFVPLMNRQSSFNDKNNVNQQGTNTTSNSAISEADQKSFLEEIVGLLPNKKGVTPSKYLFRLLRAAMILHANQSCIDNLEKRIGSQLDRVELVELLIPNMGYSVETLYDVDCIHRIIDHFISMYQPATAATSPSITEEASLIVGADALTPMTMVANLVDAYLAEVALDVNLKLPKFQALASAIPDYARPLDDALYHAIDVYLKAHLWLIDSEREQFCRLMNVQKLSLEASTHAALNERLPIRVIVQVLFFEQLRLRTSISSWLFVDNLENSQNPSGNLGLLRSNGNNGQQQEQGSDNLRDRVKEIEKECSEIRKELQKLSKTKKSWNIFSRMIFRKSSSKFCRESNGCDINTSSSAMNGKPNHSK
ncbi:PREDICTED: BTB/POZ domain-containing protein At5g03250-like [Lupinus angustifolius]|uniref:BTB/POZ domain-containing protein At5g03250-like n=1 Tax=Lupinus angustifolius TaxID=3871 RepID=UPI00092E295E|nr:PREDICTED: BTB/POZ domain-containing protein At5g03250-like [Lupinus angustifolius]